MEMHFIIKKKKERWKCILFLKRVPIKSKKVNLNCVVKVGLRAIRLHYN